MNYSILQVPSAHDAIRPTGHPYPYMVIENCLSPDLYDELEEARPSDKFLVAGRQLGSNLRIDLSARELLTRPIADIWQKFIMYHLSKEFWMEIVQVFDLNGALLKQPLLSLDQIPVTMRRDPPARGAVSMDVNVGVNSPVVGKATTVRGPHVDNPIELFAAMLYMPPKDAPDEGGDFVIYEKTRRVRFVGKAEVHPDDALTLSEHARVKYRRNTMVAFINSLDAIHGVTPRQSNQFRRLVNFVAELPTAQFTLPEISVGIGDEIMALGDAARLRRGRDFKVAIGDGRAVHWSPVHEHVPWLWRAGEHIHDDAHWIISYPSNRPYCDYERMIREARERHGWKWKGAMDGKQAFQLLKRKYWRQGYHATPAPLVLTDMERLIGDAMTSHDRRTVVLVEPNIKPGAPENKRWPFRRYQQVVNAFKDRCVFVQMSRPMLDGPVPVPALAIRSALGVVSAVDAYLGAEGALHHAAAAFCKPAVVVFGGYINPRVTGYEFHRNLWVECEDEGCPGPTPAGEAALAEITVEQVVAALDLVLSEAQ